MEKFPIQAIQQGLEAFRQIVYLERRRARQRATRVVSKQGGRVGLYAFAALVIAFAIHLALFWWTVALYQGGWSIGKLMTGILLLGVGVGLALVAWGSWLARGASLRSIVETSNEQAREDRTRTTTRKRAA